MATRSKGSVGQSALVGLAALTLCTSCISYRVYVDKQDRTVQGYATATAVELGVGGAVAVLAPNVSVSETLVLALTIAILGDAVLALTLANTD